MQRKIKQALTVYDIENNASKIDELFQLAIVNLPKGSAPSTSTQISRTKHFLSQFVQKNGISLGTNNLDDAEEMELLQIIIQALQRKEKDFERELETALLNWMKTLKHAVSGQGAHVEQHLQQSSGMAADLIDNGMVHLATWGTDLDVKHCLGRDLTDPRKITNPGTYILTPVSLTQWFDSSSPIVASQNLLREVFNSIKANNITGRVLVDIPVNCGDSHWRLAKYEINHQQLTSAVLWDSLSGNSTQIKATTAFKNFTTIVESFSSQVTPQLFLAGIQQNGHSCMDYTLQQAYRDAGKINEMTQATDSSALRLAIVKQIANNHPAIDKEAVAHLQINGNEIVPFGMSGQQHVIALDPGAEKTVNDFLDKFTSKEKSKTLSQEDKEWQITFDAVFSEHLQHLYDKNSTTNIKESDLVLEAKRKAIQEIGFFPPSAKKRETDLQNEETFKFRYP